MDSLRWKEGVIFTLLTEELPSVCLFLPIYGDRSTVGVCAMECLLLLSSGESQRSITSTFLGVLLSVIKPVGEGASLILPSALVALRMLNRRSMVFLFAPTSLAV